jgi:predicted nucleic acid-binding protein
VAWVYVDTSAMVKRYVDERGHRQVLRLLRRHELVSSVLLPLELRSAIRRRVLDRRLETARANSVLKRFALDRAVLATVELTSEVLLQAESLVAAYPIRALDAIQVSSARLFASRLATPALFVSADKRQADVAAAVGLHVTLIG